MVKLSTTSKGISVERENVFQNVAMVCDETAQKFDLLSEDLKCSYFLRTISVRRNKFDTYKRSRVQNSIPIIASFAIIIIIQIMPHSKNWLII